jgi:hypothetical protein
MAESTFRSPGFFEREIDQSTVQATGPSGVPAGVVGTSNKGPAFVPVTVASFDQFRLVFGDLDPKRFGPYAANEFLKHRNALTFLRVLGAGTTDTVQDISKVSLTGQVKNAGFVVTGTQATNDTRHKGAVQFLAAQHTLRTNEAFGMPMFTNDESFAGSAVNLVRGVLLLASGTRMMVLPGSGSVVSAFAGSYPSDAGAVDTSGHFKLILSSTLGAAFATTDGLAGLKVYTASLNPTDPNYFAKLLNNNPDQFASLQHVVYADFAVDDEVATATNVAIMSGSGNTSLNSGDTSMVFRDTFGHFDARFQTPKTPSFISQPFGKTEYDLFYFEALDDGEFANSLYKVTIANLKQSTDQSNPYGTFSVLVRDWNDNDVNQNVLEQFPNCTLNPNADNYVAKVIGDRKVTYNFDSENPAERRLLVSGKYGNKSNYIRVVTNQQVDDKTVPAASLPFGFRGIETLKTNDSLADASGGARRLAGVGVGPMAQAIVPPVPFRFKVTKGDVATSGFVGAPGSTEVTNGNLCWGVKFERNNNDVLNTNINSDKNNLLLSLTKFAGIRKLDALVTGSGADTFCDNKFTLARVAFSNTSVSDLTASVEAHMKEAAYVRNASPNPGDYTVNDGTISNRITFGTLAAQSTATQFNRFSPFAKFTTFLAGGFDGVNTLDQAARRMNDRAVSFDVGGAAESSYVSPGLAQNQNGVGASNSSVFSYKTAIDIMTSPMNVNLNILAVPGIREPYLTGYASQGVKTYGMAIYLMDIVQVDENSTRLYDDSTVRPDVAQTATTLDGRSIDNDYVASYFPDVFIDDSVNKRRVKVPPSVAALAALGLNDRVSAPWFAPAGFNRAALDFVTNVGVRLNQGDRDVLQDVRINPIATFPRQGFVIFGQKTLKQSKGALDRVNVRRLVLEIKRIVTGLALNMVFEQNTRAVRDKFVSDATTQIGLIQLQAGVERFKVIMDDTNNSDVDAQNNRVNGRIVFVPTRTIEFVGIDFIITNSGVAFV